MLYQEKSPYDDNGSKERFLAVAAATTAVGYSYSYYYYYYY